MVQSFIVRFFRKPLPYPCSICKVETKTPRFSLQYREEVVKFSSNLSDSIPIENDHYLTTCLCSME